MPCTHTYSLKCVATVWPTATNLAAPINPPEQTFELSIQSD